jgi:hypothetical protein
MDFDASRGVVLERIACRLQCLQITSQLIETPARTYADGQASDAQGQSCR